MKVSNEDIAEYYDTHQFWYTYFWSPTGLHYGFWYDDTKTPEEAVINTNKFVAEVLGIDSSDVVLDAGCGIGGSSMYVAEKTGAKVEGITLSSVQLKIARKKAAQSKAASLLSFSRQDFTQTNFGEGTFSKVFGIEAICYANQKIDFLREAYRVMKSGGKIAIVDAFLTKNDLAPEETKIYTKFLQGWQCPNLATKDGFSDDLAQAGFKNVFFHDMHDKVKKSSERIYRHSRFTYPMNFISSKLGLSRENFSARYQKPLFDQKIAIYGVFVAEKLV